MSAQQKQTDETARPPGQAEQPRPPGPAEPPRPASRAMVLALAGVAALSGILIVFAFQLTEPTIKAAKARALKKSVFEVIPRSASMATFRLEADGKLALLVGEDDKAVKFYAGYGADGTLRGVAIEAQGQGFQDVIKVLYGYSPESESVVGMRVLESKETPGLGDKIGIDPHFLAIFEDLDVKLAADGTRLLHPIKVARKGTRRQKWQIDSITGATISAKAIGKLMNRSAQVRIPQVMRNLDKLREAP